MNGRRGSAPCRLDQRDTISEAERKTLSLGIHVDRDGNVWATDSMGNEAGTKGHQVFKFSPEGEVLLALGQAGQPGSAPGQLNEPCDVITAENGDIFVSDGHSGQGADPAPDKTGRILKFDAQGNFIKEWGQIGSGPGEFRTPHALAFDSQGRLFVADRGNHRIQIFDQDGNYLDSYYQFSRISGFFITADDTLYAIDSESSPNRHPGWSTGIRIGKASADVVTAFIPPHETDRGPHGAAGEGVAVDADGNVYAAEGPISRAVAEGGNHQVLGELSRARPHRVSGSTRLDLGISGGRLGIAETTLRRILDRVFAEAARTLGDPLPGRGIASAGEDGG